MRFAGHNRSKFHPTLSPPPRSKREPNAYRNVNLPTFKLQHSISETLAQHRDGLKVRGLRLLDVSRRPLNLHAAVHTIGPAARGHKRGGTSVDTSGPCMLCQFAPLWTAISACLPSLDGVNGVAGSGYLGAALLATCSVHCASCRAWSGRVQSGARVAPRPRSPLKAEGGLSAAC